MEDLEYIVLIVGVVLLIVFVIFVLVSVLIVRKSLCYEIERFE